MIYLIKRIVVNKWYINDLFEKKIIKNSGKSMICGWFTWEEKRKEKEEVVNQCYINRLLKREKKKKQKTNGHKSLIYIYI